MPDIRRSSIVNAYVVDQFGGNPKRRFNLVVEVDDGSAFALAISSSVEFNELTEFQLELPYKSDGSCSTGLTERCVVCCDWLNEIPLNECRKTGYVPGKLMPPIIDALNKYVKSVDGRVTETGVYLKKNKQF